MGFILGRIAKLKRVERGEAIGPELSMIVAQILDKIDENQKQGKSDVRPVAGNPQSSMLIVDSSEYKEGEAAFCRGFTTRNNPYPFRSPEYWRWQEGLLGNCRPRERQVDPEEKSHRFLEQCRDVPDEIPVTIALPLGFAGDEDELPPDDPEYKAVSVIRRSQSPAPT